MIETRDNNLSQLRDQLAAAEYRVDPVAVAEAIVRRRWSVAIASHSGSRTASSPRPRSRAQVSCIARRGASSRMRALAA